MPNVYILNLRNRKIYRTPAGYQMAGGGGGRESPRGHHSITEQKAHPHGRANNPGPDIKPQHRWAWTWQIYSALRRLSPRLLRITVLTQQVSGNAAFCPNPSAPALSSVCGTQYILLEQQPQLLGGSVLSSKT